MAIVYQHRTADTNSIFYIGIGRDINRAQTKAQRPDYWKRVVNKHGRIVEILFSDISVEEAKQIEIYLIRFYGKRRDGGILVNLTDGGDGNFGKIVTPDERARISKSLTGKKQSAETKEKRAAKLRGKKSSPEAIAKRIAKTTGKKRTEEFRQKCRERAGTFSKESIEKMRMSHLGIKTIPCSEEKKMAISAAQKGIPKPKKENDKSFRTGKDHPMFGKKASQEARDNMSKAMKGVKKGPMPEKNRIAISESLKGIPKSEDHKIALRKARELKKLEKSCL